MWEIIFCSRQILNGIALFRKTRALNGVFVFKALDPRPHMFALGRSLGAQNLIITVSRNRLVWSWWSIKILHKKCSYFKNTIHIINRRIFRVSFAQGTFSTLAFVSSGIDIVAQSINTTNTKVCMFRELSRDVITAWNWDILRASPKEELQKCYK